LPTNYAGGLIKGKWIKREGGPSDAALLFGRIIDRAVGLYFQLVSNEVN
jgi:polyribonucleotide nucleotidyltransferase